MSELKPCPWCGHEPDTGPDDWKREGDAFGYVVCSNDSCVAKPCVRIHGEFVHGGGFRNSVACLERAITAWNTRNGDEK